MNNLNWPESATHYGSETKEFNPGFYKYKDGKWLFMSEYGAPNGVWYHVGPGDDSARYVERPKQPQAWSGPEDGLPPVGLEVEATYDDGSYSWGYWLNTKVLCYGEERTFVNQLSRGTENTWLEGAITSAGLKYRPIKTAEQLAASARESAIREVMDIAQVDCRVTAARLVDAGFKREGK